jgi:hypothetical protein
VDLALANSMGESRRHPLPHLRELHLAGPLSCDYACYILTGCNNLRSLTLGVEWLDSAFSNALPASRRDLLGREYLEELRGVNPNLIKLSELRLFAQYSRGRTRLDKEFALYILAAFKDLRHFGNFVFWKMTQAEKQAVFAEARKANRNITFDEDYSEKWSGGSFNFRKHIRDGYPYHERMCLLMPARSPFHYVDEVRGRLFIRAWLFGSRFACAQAVIFFAKPYPKNAGEASIGLWVAA